MKILAELKAKSKTGALEDLGAKPHLLACFHRIWKCRILGGLGPDCVSSSVPHWALTHTLGQKVFSQATGASLVTCRLGKGAMVPICKEKGLTAKLLCVRAGLCWKGVSCGT